MALEGQAPSDMPLAARAMELLRQFDRWSLRHERRGENVRADVPANLALTPTLKQAGG